MKPTLQQIGSYAYTYHAMINGHRHLSLKVQNIEFGIKHNSEPKDFRHYCLDIFINCTASKLLGLLADLRRGRFGAGEGFGFESRKPDSRIQELRREFRNPLFPDNDSRRPECFGEKVFGERTGQPGRRGTEGQRVGQQGGLVTDDRGFKSYLLTIF